MDKRVWLSPRGAETARGDPRPRARVHGAVRVAVVRAVGGNSLSWAYVFEWPLFAGYAIYMWWRFVHEKPEEPLEAVESENGHADAMPQALTGAPAAQAAQEDAELAAYNAYLARLAERDRATGR